MRFSVVVPAFNEERYLPRSLSSIRYADLALKDEFPGASADIIVVDNGSTDRTAAVAREFDAVVVQEPKRGIALARNAGARAAVGDVLVFLDADYRVLPSFLNRLAHGYRGDSSIAAAGVRVALEPSEIDPITRSLGYAGLALLRRIRNMSFGVATFRRDRFEALGGYDEGLFALEDVEILERLVRGSNRRFGRYRILRDVLVFASARGSGTASAAGTSAAARYPGGAVADRAAGRGVCHRRLLTRRGARPPLLRSGRCRAAGSRARPPAPSSRTWGCGRRAVARARTRGRPGGRAGPPRSGRRRPLGASRRGSGRGTGWRWRAPFSRGLALVG